MAEWLRYHGIATEHIVEEPQATSTNENLEKAWALLDEPTQLTVVTNNFHALRTKVWAWHLGIPIEVVEAPTPPESKLRNYPRVIIALPHSITRMLWRKLKAVLG